MAASCFALQVPDVKRIAGPGAAMCFRFLLKFRSRNIILDRGLIPKPFGFSQELQCNSVAAS